MNYGNIIIVNGLSSAGKSTLNNLLMKHIDVPVLHPAKILKKTGITENLSKKKFNKLILEFIERELKKSSCVIIEGYPRDNASFRVLERFILNRKIKVLVVIEIKSSIISIFKRKFLNSDLRLFIYRFIHYFIYEKPIFRIYKKKYPYEKFENLKDIDTEFLRYLKTINRYLKK